ncbi:MAG: hypothetical protein U0176_11920 [Bacteroidia bacterium]
MEAAATAPTDTAYLSIVVNPSLSFTLGPDQTICQGDVALLDPGIPGATYLWSDNTTAPTLHRLCQRHLLGPSDQCSRMQPP